jgi:hypothetical protein
MRPQVMHHGFEPAATLIDAELAGEIDALLKHRNFGFDIGFFGNGAVDGRNEMGEAVGSSLMDAGCARCR